MPLSRREVIEVCREVARQDNLRATVRESGKGALMAAGGAFFGGILGGPIGLAVGGSLAACYSAYSARGCYKSVVDIIENDMTDEQRENLASAVRRAVTNIDVPTAMGLMVTLASDPSIKLLIVREISKFIANEMHLVLV